MKTPKTDKEIAAKIAHDVWAHWMRYFFTLKPTPEDIERWKRQAETPFEKLSEKEQKSDYEVADEHITPSITSIRKEEQEKLEGAVDSVVSAVGNTLAKMQLQGKEIHYECWKAQWRHDIDAATTAAKPYLTNPSTP